ncbi:MAG: alanyl-tRNA editing protein [Armatimonadota bacterium]|nr:alanyl-tRNA editing protein [Armatimonadota bacterium]
MTEPLYLRDSYLREFDATVVAAEGQAVALDRTAFYPGGGGLPFDTGRLAWPGTESRVAEMKRDGATLWHVLDGPVPPVGQVVHGSLDWERRYGVMRHHTALHVLVGAVYKLFSALVTGGAIYPDRARMDFALEDLSKERVAAIEDEANRVLSSRRRVLIRFVTREEFERSDLTRLARNLVPDLPQIRVVEIENYDAQADGGTHVANTREVGRLRITRTENKGKANRRLEIALEHPGD